MELESSQDLPRPEEYPPTPRPFSDTLDFLRKAQELGVNELVLGAVEGEKREDRAKTLQVADDYFNTEFSAKDLGIKYFGTESFIFSRRNAALRLLHQYSPEELQAQYPLHELTVGKPRTDWARLKTSISFGSNADKIAQSLRTGATAQGVMLEFGLSVEAASGRRRMLKSLNINVPHQIPGLNIAREIAEGLNDSHLTDEKAQALLDKVLLSYYRHNHGPKGSLMNLKELASSAGFRYTNNQTRLFAALDGKVPKALLESSWDKKQGVSRKRRFIFRHHMERGIKALQEDPSLQNLRIK